MTADGGRDGEKDLGNSRNDRNEKPEGNEERDAVSLLTIPQVSPPEETRETGENATGVPGEGNFLRPESVRSDALSVKVSLIAYDGQEGEELEDGLRREGQDKGSVSPVEEETVQRRRPRASGRPSPRERPGISISSHRAFGEGGAAAGASSPVAQEEMPTFDRNSAITEAEYSSTALAENEDSCSLEAERLNAGIDSQEIRLSLPGVGESSVVSGDAYAEVAAAARYMNFPPPAAEWRGVDALLPFLTKVRNDGGTIVITIDGGRMVRGTRGCYTVAVTGKTLGDGAIRKDADTLEEALSFVIVEHAKKYWGFN